MTAPLIFTTASNWYPNIFVSLLYIAMLTPIAGGYFSGMMLIIWAMTTGRHKPALSQEHMRREERLRQLLKPLNLSIWVFVGLQVVSALSSYFTSEFQPTLRESLVTTWHLFGKWLLLWLALSQGTLVLVKLDWSPRQLIRVQAPWMILYFLYCVAQRQWGLDWVRGFGKTLGQNRYAYDAFRVSGLMSHPLTLTYNLMLILFLSITLSQVSRKLHNEDGLPSTGFQFFSKYSSVTEWIFSWQLITILSAAILAISGSRFVLLILPPVLILSYLGPIRAYLTKKAPKHPGPKNLSLVKKAMTFAMVLMVFILAAWLGSSTWQRFFELFDTAIPWQERWPRLVYWDIHWSLFLGHPLFGVSVAKVSEAAKGMGLGLPNSMEIMNAHNLFLQFLADSGLVGFSGLISLIYGLFRTWQSPLLLGPARHGFAMAALGMLAASVAQNVLRDSEFVFCFWLTLTTVLAIGAESPDEALPYVP